jgi:Double zinc ribbon
MGILAIFGITNDALSTVVSLLLLCLVAVWAALVFWTYQDAKRRIADPMLVGCATAASLFPFFGTIVYMIVRPPEYLDDVRERELEMLAAEARLSQAEIHHCPYCDFEIEKSFLRCPSCLRKLKEPCMTCGKPLDPRWKICPYCEAEIGQAPPRRRAAAQATGSRPAAAPRAAAGGATVARTQAPPYQGDPPTRTHPSAG